MHTLIIHFINTYLMTLANYWYLTLCIIYTNYANSEYVNDPIK